MKEYARAFYKSTAWQQCRAAYIKSVGGLCERCLAEGKIVPGYIVHHKCYLTPDNILDPDVSLNWNNLEYLCHDCHNKEHFKEEYKKRYTIEKDGTIKTIG
jgi:5-methylcytosine-specific restriction endonuclease McrA